jgi:hypothetical protein
MPVFQIVPLSTNFAALTAAVGANFPEKDRFELPHQAGWLVQFDGTSIEASNFIGLTGQPKGESSPIGPALITHIVSYYGRGPTDMWEWIKLKFEASS